MRNSRRQLLIRPVILAFLLQALIPVGYMPANLLDGKFVELCPAGMTAQQMAKLLGDQHRHHAHHHAHHDATADSPTFAQCDLGGGHGAPLAAESQPHVFDDVMPARSSGPATESPRAMAQNKANRQRAPPSPGSMIFSI